MKKTIMFLFFLLLLLPVVLSKSVIVDLGKPIYCALSSDKYYYYGAEDKKIPLLFSTNEIYVSFKDNLTESEKEDILGIYGNYKSSGLDIIFKDCKSEIGIKKIVDSLRLNDKVRFVYCAYYLGNRTEENINYFSSKIFFKDTISVGLMWTDNGLIMNKEEFDEMNKEYGLKIVSENWGNRPNVYKVGFIGATEKTSLEIANLYQDSGLFEFASPGMITTMNVGNSPKFEFIYDKTVYVDIESIVQEELLEAKRNQSNLSNASNDGSNGNPLDSGLINDNSPNSGGNSPLDTSSTSSRDISDDKDDDSSPVVAQEVTGDYNYYTDVILYTSITLLIAVGTIFLVSKFLFKKE